MPYFSFFSTMAGLIAAVSWGAADFFGARASKSMNPILVALFVQLIGAVLFGIAFLLFMNPDLHINQKGFLFGAGAGIFMSFGLSNFYKALEKGPVSIVAPIGAAYPLVTTLLVIGFFGEYLEVRQLVGILLVIFGVIAVSGLASVNKEGRKFTKGVVLAIMAAIFWGVAFTFLGQAIDLLGWQAATFLDLVFSVLGYTLILPFVKNENKISRKNLRIFRNKFVIIAAVAQIIGMISFNIGLTRTSSVAIITAISACYPLLTILLALQHFDEKMKLAAMVGVILSLCGVVLLSITCDSLISKPIFPST